MNWIWNAIESIGETRLSAGTHIQNFECELAAGLPSSIDYEVGHIAYSVRVVLDRPIWKKEEYIEKFTVIKPKNLNVDPSFGVIDFITRYLKQV